MEDFEVLWKKLKKISNGTSQIQYINKFQNFSKTLQSTEDCNSKKLLRIGQNHKQQNCSSYFCIPVYFWQKIEFSSNIERIVKLKTIESQCLNEFL